MRRSTKLGLLSRYVASVFTAAALRSTASGRQAGSRRVTTYHYAKLLRPADARAPYLVWPATGARFRLSAAQVIIATAITSPYALRAMTSLSLEVLLQRTMAYVPLLSMGTPRKVALCGLLAEDASVSHRSVMSIETMLRMLVHRVASTEEPVFRDQERAELYRLRSGIYDCDNTTRTEQQCERRMAVQLNAGPAGRGPDVVAFANEFPVLLQAQVRESGNLGTLVDAMEEFDKMSLPSLPCSLEPLKVMVVLAPATADDVRITEDDVRKYGGAVMSKSQWLVELSTSSILFPVLPTLLAHGGEDIRESGFLA